LTANAASSKRRFPLTAGTFAAGCSAQPPGFRQPRRGGRDSARGGNGNWLHYPDAKETRQPTFSSRLTLDLYRLRAATKTLTGANDIVEMAQLALQEGQAGEAKKVLEDGFAAGLLGKGPEAERQKRLLALANQRVAEAPATLAAAEAEAATAKDGTALVRIGLAYSGLGQHDKGIALIEQGIAKGGIKRLDDARLHLGIALLRAGQKARAAQVLKTVGGADGTADLARLWMKAP
jgi:hypothetical protein